MIALLLLLLLSVSLSWLLWLLRDRKPLLAGEVVVARTLYSCGTTLIIISAPVTLLAISIDASLYVFAEIFRAMPNKQRVIEQTGEDKLEVSGGCGTERASASTIGVKSSFTDVALDLCGGEEAPLGSEKTMEQAKTGVRLRGNHKERKPGEEPSAAPLSHRAARKAKRATSKAALVSNMSTAQEASTPGETTKKVAKRGRDSRKKDPVPPASGSDYSDTSVVARSSKTKSAISSKPGAEAEATDVTGKVPKQADNSSTRIRRQNYPPELESFHKKASRVQEWTRLAQQLKAALVFGKSTENKNVIAAEIYDLINEMQADVGGDGPLVAPRVLQWKPASTFGTREEKVVKRALQASMDSKAFKELAVGDDYDFSESAQQWWNRHRPSTDVQNSLESSTIEALDVYGDHVRTLMECRADLDLYRRARSAASSRLGSASITLQCLVRQGTYHTKFWRSLQQSAVKVLRQAVTALRKARASEARAVSTVRP